MIQTENQVLNERIADLLQENKILDAQIREFDIQVDTLRETIEEQKEKIKDLEEQYKQLCK